MRRGSLEFRALSLLEELGRGSFRIVYKAENRARSCRCAQGAPQSTQSIQVSLAIEQSQLAARQTIGGRFMISVRLMGSSLSPWGLWRADRSEGIAPKRRLFGSEGGMFSQILRAFRSFMRTISSAAQMGNIIAVAGIAHQRQPSLPALPGDAARLLASGGMIGARLHVAPEIWESRRSGIGLQPWLRPRRDFDREGLFDGESAAGSHAVNCHSWTQTGNKSAAPWRKNILGQCRAKSRNVTNPL